MTMDWFVLILFMLAVGSVIYVMIQEIKDLKAEIKSLQRRIARNENDHMSDHVATGLAISTLRSHLSTCENDCLSAMNEVEKQLVNFNNKTAIYNIELKKLVSKIDTL